MRAARPIVTVILLAVATTLLQGCKRSIQVDGEVFLRKPNGQIERGAGDAILLIPEGETGKIDAYMRDWKGRHRYEGGRAQWELDCSKLSALEKDSEASSGRTNSLVEILRQKNPFDPSSNDQMTLEWGRQYPDLIATIPDAKADFDRLEQKHAMTYSQLVSFRSKVKGGNFLFAPEGKNLADRWRSFREWTDVTLTDAERKSTEDELKSLVQQFEVIMTDSEGKFKIALKKGSTYYVLSGNRWLFKFRANGQKLILSNDNALE